MKDCEFLLKVKHLESDILSCLYPHIQRKEKNRVLIETFISICPPVGGGCENQKLVSESSITSDGLARLESVLQPGSAVKAAFFLGAFLPDYQHGSGVGDGGDGGGHCPAKDKSSTPVGRMCKFRRTGPSQVEFNVGRLA